MGQGLDSLKHGLQVGAGFFVGYFLMRFLSIMAMIVVGTIIITAVCVPTCEKYENEIITPVENASGVSFDLEQVTWPQGCRVRARPSTNSRIIGHVTPKRRYYVMQRKGRWIKVGGFTLKGWVGCKAHRPSTVEI